MAEQGARARRGGPKRARPVAAAAALLLTAGCYSYRPVAGVAPAPGAELRVQLTDAGMSELTRYLGPRVMTVDGRLVEIEPDSTLMLSVKAVHTAEGGLQRWPGEGTVRVPNAAVASVSRRTLSRKRTAVFAGGLTAALVAIGVYALDLGRAGGSPGGNGPPPP